MFTYMNCLSQLLANFIGIIYLFLSFLGAGWTELLRFYSSVETVYLLEFIFAYSMRQGSEYFNSQAYKELKETEKGRMSGECSIPLQAFIQAGLRSDRSCLKDPLLCIWSTNNYWETLDQLLLKSNAKTDYIEELKSSWGNQLQTLQLHINPYILRVMILRSCFTIQMAYYYIS